MFVRRRPLLRAAVVGGGAYMVGKRSGERSAEQPAQQSAPQAQQSQPSQQVQQAQQAQPEASRSAGQVPGPAAGMADQLRQLSDLHAQGALTDAEFAQAKSRLLGR